MHLDNYMKAFSKWLIVFLTTSIYIPIGNVFAEGWGEMTNGVQISIGIGGSQPITTNAPVILSLRIKNTLTNESFCFLLDGETTPSFSYNIISPSGKTPLHNDNVILTDYRSGATWISQNTTKAYTINLSDLYIFNEIGAYKIIVTGRMEARTTVLSHGDTVYDDNKAFEVVSNPLLVTLVGDK